jgi:hypothetical protein
VGVTTFEDAPPLPNTATTVLFADITRVATTVIIRVTTNTQGRMELERTISNFPTNPAWVESSWIESLTTNSLRNRPDLWTPNTEIDLGGGEFGYLISKSDVTAAPNTHNEQFFAVSAPITRIVEVGGEWEFSTGTFMTYGGISTASARISANVSREINRIIFYSHSDAQRTNASVWIWVIYRK